MMIGPVSYIENLKDAEYLELIKERYRLNRFIKKYEKKDNVNTEMAERELQKAILALKVLEHKKLKRKRKGVKY